jgi:D-amino peptidase
VKLYISFDIEGISGITDVVDIDVNSPGFAQTRELSTRDVNAAIEGALEAGVTDILVYDSHGWGRRNVLYEGIHPKAKLLKGRVSSVGLNMPAMDGTFDAVFFIGWHARPSAPGILSHCLNSRVFTAWRVNGTPVGEPELAAAVAGQYGVPLVLFTGDDCSCEEVRAWCPGCECVVTKCALDRFSAICLSKEVTYDLIREGALRALRRRADIKPFRFETPIRVEADTLFDHTAAAISLIPTIERKSLLTIGFESNDYVQAFRTIQAIQLMSGVAQ